MMIKKTVLYILLSVTCVLLVLLGLYRILFTECKYIFESSMGKEFYVDSLFAVSVDNYGSSKILVNVYPYNVSPNCKQLTDDFNACFQFEPYFIRDDGTVIRFKRSISAGRYNISPDFNLGSILYCISFEPTLKAGEENPINGTRILHFDCSYCIDSSGIKVWRKRYVKFDKTKYCYSRGLIFH